MQLNGPAKSCLIATSGSLAKGFLTVASGRRTLGGGGGGAVPCREGCECLGLGQLRLAAGKDELREQVDETSAQEDQRGPNGPGEAGNHTHAGCSGVAFSETGPGPEGVSRSFSQEFRSLSERINRLAPREQLLEI